MTEPAAPRPILAPELSQFSASGIRHGYFTRAGGVSSGIYRGLNVGQGSNDAPADIAENRARVARHLGVAPAALVSVHQIHSPDVVVAREPFAGERPKADAMVTDRPGIALGVLTADCGPVLFADERAQVIGAAHAGWKGALTGVLESTIAAMEALGADRGRIVAVLGPSISKAAYEVGPEFVQRFTEADPDNARWFLPSSKEGHAMFDLQGYTVERLARAGVAAAGQTGHCTYGDEDTFFSYRRTTHRNEPDYGRQISAIVLEG